MRIDPVSLKLFVSVVEEGTIAAAAEREHIAAPAVSKRISELESILCCQLLIRTKSGVEPTAAGNALLNLARRLVHDLEDIYVQMQDYASGVRGHVRVLTNISALTQFLPTELASFRAAHPAVQIGLEERNSSVIAKAVAENAADVGVFTMFPHGQDIEVFPYHRDCLTLVCSPTHPLATGSRSPSRRRWNSTMSACAPGARSTCSSSMPLPGRTAHCG